MPLGFHRHGKTKVRVARVWRAGDRHTFREWSVDIMLESDMAHAYTAGSNEGMTATDTMKNTVYHVAKGLSEPCSPEYFGAQLARHFTSQYEKVTKATVGVEMMPWKRATVAQQEHNHGYECTGTEVRTAEVIHRKNEELCDVTSGVRDLKILKTTQSGFEGYLKDEYTKLPETKDRIMATSVTCNWSYSTGGTDDYDEFFECAKMALLKTFFGPPEQGTYSPSVQFTLYGMGTALLEAVPLIKSVHLRMPNLHFLPSGLDEPGFDFVYIPTNEPHGDIEATVERNPSQ